MSLQKPTIVFVTGAWHGPHLYAPLTSGLEAAGYTVRAPALPSVGGEQSDFSEDVAAIREAITASTDSGIDVVVLMHSYGGVPAGEAVKGLTRLDQSDRSKGSVVRMIYLCAFALAEKGSLNAALNNEPLPWWKSSDNDKQWFCQNVDEIFFNDVDKETAEDVKKQLVGHAKGVFDSKVTYAAFKHVQSSYIICEKDNAIPLPIQEGMAGQPGSKFEVQRLDAGHSPFLSKNDETVKAVRKAIGESL